jgi:DNA-directed RNA polymerase subunit RPC12/RpoP
LFETFKTDYAICPYCGNQHIIEKENMLEKGNGLYTCSKCQKKFYLEISREIYMTTTEMI